METKILDEGNQAPNFCLLDAYENKRCIGDFEGKWIVLYFYPKDNTPGCTIEAIDFSALRDEFEKHDAIILGISKDSCESHQKFIDKKGISIILLSDPDSEIQKKFGVWRPKKFMGKEFLGTVRSTFIIDPEGKIVRVYDNVKAKGHAQSVLDELIKIKS